MKFKVLIMPSQSYSRNLISLLAKKCHFSQKNDSVLQFYINLIQWFFLFCNKMKI